MRNRLFNSKAQLLLNFLLLFVFALLFACSGGGSSGDGVTVTNAVMGHR